MKNPKNELNVDFIGGQEPLTKEEEKAISDYIKAKKLSAEKLPSVRSKRIVKRERSVA